MRGLGAILVREAGLRCVGGEVRPRVKGVASGLARLAI